MWRNGSGHRAVRSSGPRSHASGSDNQKKNTKQDSSAEDIARLIRGNPKQEEINNKRALIEQRVMKSLLKSSKPVIAPAPKVVPPPTVPSVEGIEEQLKK
eukprot:Tbor_TRINITY_DN5708_c1_g2::TRINITY_DN5708_c1_g2_i2::g.19962::m.19962